MALTITSFRSTFRSFGLLLAVFFMTSFALAQNDYVVNIQNERITMPENIDSFQWSDMPEHAKLSNGYYGWIQFYETPVQAIQDQFKAQNLTLIEYLPKKTYLFYFNEAPSVSFLQNSGVRSIVPVPGEYKLSEALRNGDHPAYAKQGSNLIVTLQFHEQVDANYVIQDLASQQISVQQQYKGSNNIDLIIPDNCLETLSNLPYVKWVELIVAPDVKDDTRGRSLHRANGLDTQTSAGRNYTGEGIGVLCRDDGIVGPHIDFQGRIDNSGASGTGQTHGDGVSGIMSGAGNLNPDMRGMAAGSLLYVSNYAANFLDGTTTSLINSGQVQITNSSYSNGCNAGYTTITQTVDSQSNNNPSLLHVFSGGNSNNNDCGYGAGNQWGNITGGHKQGKNVIATANVFFDGSLVNSSSRGPAHDGRIKPDIAANGQNQNSTDENNGYLVFGGTSGAAPGIAGVSAQLYEAYGDANGGTLPPSALIKASLLNTANDAGNIGPDFRFGWGIVNGLRAVQLIEDNRFLIDNLSQGDTNGHTIAVPAGTAQVRFMLYWNDPAASPGTGSALVNDLDLLVTDPGGNNLEPWILDSTPNPTALNTPATTGPDHLNNMEQVLINAPAAGNYNLEITGFDVPMGPQEYFVVYEIITENLTLTYPNAGESFVPGQTESIHWDAINTTAGFTLEYSNDNGGSWNTINTVPSNITNFAWNVPSDITGEAKVRITSGAFQDESDEAFSIATQASNVQITQVCPDEASFTWNAVANADEYDLYLLGTRYMEVVGTATTNSITVPITDPNAPIWAAVVARNTTDGWESKRTIAVNHGGGLLNCALANDLAVASIENTNADFALVCAGSNDVIISATFANTGFDDQSGFDVSYQLNGEPAVVEPFPGTLNSGQQSVYTFTTPLTITASGEYTLTVSIVNAGDQNASNDSQDLTVFAVTDATSLNFTEDFQTNSVPPPAWNILNSDNDDTWIERTGIVGADGNTTDVAFVDNYSYNAQGEEDILQTEIFDLTNSTGEMLTFDLAKAQFSAQFSDELRVDLSTDCGATFTQIYFKEGLDLSTLATYTTANTWSPGSAADWRTETIDLTPYSGEVVMINFVNINGFGNSTHIDNINLTAETLAVSDNQFGTISMYPNPTSNTIFFELSQVQAATVDLELVNSLGQRLQQLTADTANRVSMDVSGYASGIYFVTIKAGGLTQTKKLVIQ